MASKIPRRYQLADTIGSGAFGVVHKVIDLGDNNKIKVIKQINLEKSSLETAKNEAKFLGKLDHPFIVKYYDDFENGGFLHIVTEFCEGGDLESRLQKYNNDKVKLETNLILDWFCELLSGVKYMHSKKIYHRDFKPQNVYLKKLKHLDVEVVKIGDFGVSKDFLNSEASKIQIGTMGYMAPEVFDEKPYTSKSDIWSLGCILYELCTYKKTFNLNDDNKEKYKEMLKNPPELPNEHFQGMYKRMLDEIPDKRPSAKELLNENLLNDRVNFLIEEQLNNLQNKDLDKKKKVAYLKNVSLFTTALDSADEEEGAKTENVDHKPVFKADEEEHFEKLANRLSQWKIKEPGNITNLDSTTIEDVENWFKKSGGLPKNLEASLLGRLRENRIPAEFQKNARQYLGIQKTFSLKIILHFEYH